MPPVKKQGTGLEQGPVDDDGYTFVTCTRHWSMVGDADWPTVAASCTKGGSSNDSSSRRRQRNIRNGRPVRVSAEEQAVSRREEEDEFGAFHVKYPDEKG
jgi:hypothetical protein